MERSIKYGLGLMLIGVVILVIPFGSGGGTFWQTIFGSSPWLAGSNGQVATQSGTYQTTLIPSGQLSFKTILTANYTDGTSEVIFSKDTLPALYLAVVTVHGKPVKELNAFMLVGIQTSTPLPSGSMAAFKVNVTNYISGLGKAKWQAYANTVQLALINNGASNIALATLPPFPVLPSDVYSDNPTTQQTREVSWHAVATVVITAPGFRSLTLVGDTLSFADLAWDGSLQVGCTDCGGTGGSSGGTIGGGVTGGASGWTVINPSDPCSQLDAPSWCTPSPSAAECQSIPKQQGCTTTEAKTTTETTVTPEFTTSLAPAPPITSTITSCSVDNSGSFTVRTHNSNTNTDTVSTYTPPSPPQKLGSNEYVDVTQESGSIAGSGFRPGMNHVEISVLPYGSAFPLTWMRLDVTGDTVVLVSPGVQLLIVVLGLLVFAAYLTGKKKAK